MKCVNKCEFIGETENSKICRYHKVAISEDKDGHLHRCIQCERHAYYNRLVNEMDGVIDEYNGFVSKMDKKVDDIHFLMQMVKEKI